MVLAVPAAEPKKLARWLGDSLPAAPLDRPQAPGRFSERYVVEQLKAARRFRVVSPKTWDTRGDTPPWPNN